MSKIKKLKKIHKEKLESMEMTEKAREICDRNEKLLEEIITKVEKLVDKISECPDKEFQVSICSNIAKIFVDASVTFAVAPNKTEDPDNLRYIG